MTISKVEELFPELIQDIKAQNFIIEDVMEEMCNDEILYYLVIRDEYNIKYSCRAYSYFDISDYLVI